MVRPLKLSASLFTFALIALFAAAPASADRPSWAGEGGKDKHGEKDEGKKNEEGKIKGMKGKHSKSGAPHFDDSNRRAVNEYYGKKFRSGKCPSGLAKKGNGCMPPGQAKKWAVGQPLPDDLKRYRLPHELLATLPPPPGGHRYVRVASDILLIATATGVVMDAIEDIGKQF